jgi:hypothetical protein
MAFSEEQEAFLLERLTRNGGVTAEILYDFIKGSRTVSRIYVMTETYGRYVIPKDIEIFLEEKCRRGLVVKSKGNGQVVWRPTSALYLDMRKKATI